MQFSLRGIALKKSESLQMGKHIILERKYALMENPIVNW